MVVERFGLTQVAAVGHASGGWIVAKTAAATFQTGFEFIVLLFERFRSFVGLV